MTSRAKRTARGALAPRRLVERPQKMFAEIHRIVGDLRNAEQSRDLGQHGRQGAASAQSQDHARGNAGHQAANKLGPDVGWRNALQRAARDLARHGIPRILIELAIAFAEQGGEAQDGEPRKVWRQVRAGESCIRDPSRNSNDMSARIRSGKAALVPPSN